MMRWSLKNKIFPVSHGNFLDRTYEFYEIINNEWAGGTMVKTKFYTHIPHHSTTLGPWNDLEDIENKKLIFENVIGLGGISLNLFERAVYVETCFEPLAPHSGCLWTLCPMARSIAEYSDRSLAWEH